MKEEIIKDLADQGISVDDIKIMDGTKKSGLAMKIAAMLRKKDIPNKEAMGQAWKIIKEVIAG
ncbi:MAG: hypothetical protein JRD68_07025 [Deltaproteobacteria bacterium]|nr:hypothetical protein [Deltaproteobacteria bacterium]